MSRRVFRGLGDTGDANDPYAGSAYLGPNSGDTFYTDNPDYVYQPDPNDTGVISQFVAKFNETTAELDAKIADLAAAQQRLLAVQSIAQQNPDDYAEWQSAYDKAAAMNSVIQTAQNSVAQLQDWWASAKSAIGLSGAAGLARAGLGVLPFAIPWAAIGAIAAVSLSIAAVVETLNRFVDRMNLKAWNDENIRRSQQGLAPLPKPEAYSQSIFGDMSSIATAAMYAFIAYLIVPPILEKLKAHK